MRTCSPTADRSFPGPYLRHSSMPFSREKCSYQLDTMFNLPGFSTIPYDAAAGIALWTKIPLQRKNSRLFWNPGQGHLAVATLEADHQQGVLVPKETVCHLAGRDLLAVLTAAWNVKKHFPEISCRISHLPGAEALTEIGTMALTDREQGSAALSAVDALCMDMDPLPGQDFGPIIEMIGTRLLAPDGILLATGKSSTAARSLSSVRSLRQIATKKNSGCRASALSLKR